MATDDTRAAHPFLKGIPENKVALMESCAQEVTIGMGTPLFREGGEADTFYLLSAGMVRLELVMPGRGQVLIQTLNKGDVLGWSWLFAPYRWHFNARAISDVHAVAYDAECLRDMCDMDHELGYHLMKRVASVMVERLQNTRLQMLDLYGTVV